MTEEKRTLHHNLTEAVQGDRVVKSLQLAAVLSGEAEFVCTPITSHNASNPGAALKVYRKPTLVWRGISTKVTAIEHRDIPAIAPCERVTFQFERELSPEETARFRTFLGGFDTALREQPRAGDRSSGVRKTLEQDVQTVKVEEEEAKFSDDRKYRILALVHGEFGKRKVKNIRERGPAHWIVDVIELPTDLPSVIDDPTEFLQKDVPKADLLLALQESSNAAQLIVDYVKISGAKALLAPVDNSEWLPEGQRNQIQRQLKAVGVESSFPRPFCVFDECGNPYLDEFAKYFGRPVFRVQWERDNVTDVRVVRGSPCGCSLFVAEKLKGSRVDEAPEAAGLLHHHYPCLASMVREPDLDDTLMHKSGFATKDAVDKEIEEYKKKRASYLDPSGIK